MTTILFIHSAGAQGRGEGSFGFLENLRAILPDDWTLLAPPMPDPDAPSAAPWIEATTQALADVDDDVVALGHSLGGSILLQALARHGRPAGLLGVILLAVPFWSAQDPNVAEFALDDDDLQGLQDLKPIIMLRGSEDEVVPQDHPGRYAKVFPQVENRTLPGLDHEAACAASAVRDAVHGLVSPKL